MRSASGALLLLLSAHPVSTFPRTTTATNDELMSEGAVGRDVPFLYYPSGLVPRLLQDSGNNNNNASADSGGTANPDAVCESLNEQLRGEMTCACGRYGKRGVSVSCEAVVDTCNEDSTYCVRLSTQYYADEKGVPIVMTSCTNLTTPGLDERADSCVQVFPGSAGNFSTVTKCYATLNDQSCGCSVCDAAAVDRAATATGGGAAVSVDCCRIMDGAKATCLPVLPVGPVGVQYDQVSEEQQCKATSNGQRSRRDTMAPAAAVVLLLAGAHLLHSATTSVW